MNTYDGMYVRPNTMDDGIVYEMKEYKRMDIRPGDKVLDVGGHIGAFARLCCQKGAAEVRSFEPDPDNCDMWRLNSTLWPKTTKFSLHKRAVVPVHLEEPIKLYVNDLKNKGTHSIVPHRKRRTVDVNTIEWGSIFESYKPDVVKVDIEGAEHYLDFRLMPTSVRLFAIEIHLLGKGFRENERNILNQLHSIGFRDVYAKPDTSGKRWATFYIMERP